MPFIIVTYGPHPTLDLFRTWQTVVELILRAVAIVLTVIALIACSAAENTTDNCDEDEEDCSLLTSSNAAAGWGIFITFVAAVIQGNILLNRALNCGYIYWNLTLIMVLDMINSGVSAFFLFISALPLAVYGARWDEEEEVQTRVPPSLKAASAFCFLASFVFIALLVWILLHLIFGWCKRTEVAHAA